jgi:ribosomal protein S18 acetylase RimI-like enzyme
MFERPTTRELKMIVPDLRIFRATHDDAALLARLNKQLLEDENNRFLPSLDELASRMLDWISGLEWSVDLFWNSHERAVGYIVHGRRFNPAAPGGDEMYIRQFAIDRDNRRSGIGRAAISVFLETRCVPGMRVMLDVLETNPAGQAFWADCGFAPHATIMEMTIPKFNAT